ncbi:MAG: Ppx/GppA phosphatase family protein [Thermomicrobiales bacterium]
MPALSTPTIVAAFDIGSNSIKMTVASVSSNGGIDELYSATKTVRLGEGIDRRGSLAPDRIEAAVETLNEMSSRARASGATRLIGVATEAVRIASNGAEFLERVLRESGISTVTISGDAEASLAYTGLLADYDLTGTIVMADIGGASTELVFGDGEHVRWAKSFPIGSGRLTDSFITNDPPSSAELERCRNEASKTLAEAPFAGHPGAHLMITGGTGEYLGRLVDNIDQMNEDEITRVLQVVTALTADELAQRVEIPPIRARVLPAGIAIVAAIVARLQPTAISGARSGLRTGLLLQAARESAS